ncbi:S1/P1 nuclease [Thalassotalea nanhaiensis]|uniref:S1/P1 nuclease n=1 Tax=Thalassotalea nanhaiensis TaxID=3065648 RepID=A0ABY9TJG1_9GAMM|nr:S1/P1 nuclease [Colwelliaceae bacterium SQ345]
MTKLLLLFILCFSTNVYALSSKGHWLVCQLAFENLPSTQKDALAKLTNHFPVKQQQQINTYLNRDANFKVTFADACSWADAIRNDVQYSSFKSWHYVNVARDQISVNDDACHGHCIIDAITHHQQQFINRTSSVEKIQALLFLAHWIGDLHQPLHVSFKSDLGGNKIKVVDKINSNKHMCKNLHQVWDRCLLGQSSKNTLLNSNKDLLPASPVDYLTTDNILFWATQSLTISRSKITGYCKQFSSNLTCSSSHQAIIFDHGYYNQNRPILIKQIKLASLRLNLFLAEHL